MAKRRMFSAEVICTDDFIELPATAQAIYLQLGMAADDDGFVANPKMISRSFRGGFTCLKTLIDKKYLIPFDAGVIVITHWRLSNSIQRDRYTPTKFADEYKMLILEGNVYEKRGDM